MEYFMQKEVDVVLSDVVFRTYLFAYLLTY